MFLEENVPLEARPRCLARPFLGLLLSGTLLGWPTWLRAQPENPKTVPSNQPMDLRSNQADPNGFPLNPDWHFKADGDHSKWWTSLTKSVAQDCRVLNDRLAGCTSQAVSFDGITTHPHGLCAGIPVDHNNHMQHMNWGVATYTGEMKWQDWQMPILDYNGKRRDRLDYDDDYDFLLVRKGREGYMHANSLHPPISPCSEEGPGIGIEFGNREVAGRLHSEWWGSFSQWVQNDRRCSSCCMAVKNALTDDDQKFRQGVVIGTIGLDCVHDCRAEIHPTFAVAIRTEEMLHKKKLARERWSFFARNWSEGEGKCSAGDLHRLPTGNGPSVGQGLQRLVLWLPGNPRLPANSVGKLGPKTVLKTNNPAIKAVGVRAEIRGNAGVILDMSFPDPRQKALIDGDVYFCWNNLPGCGSPQQPTPESKPRKGRDTLNVQLQLVDKISIPTPGAGPYFPVPEK